MADNVVIYERPSEHSDKSTNRTAIRLDLVNQMDIFVFKKEDKKGKALKMKMSVGSYSSDENKGELILYAHNKEESEQLEKIFQAWCDYYNGRG